MNQTHEEDHNEKSGLGLALSGGGSRAIAFHYGVFQALHELDVDRRINVVSGISGGAVIGALWHLHSRNWELFCQRVDHLLHRGLENSILKKLLHPGRLFSQLCRLGVDTKVLADVLDDRLFGGVRLAEIPEYPSLILNATDLTTGSNFKFSKSVCGSYRHGSYSLPDLRLSQAVACSAAHPLFFKPRKLQLTKEKYALLVDGGAYDCTGTNALMPDKKNAVSILAQSCETIITSDASSPYIGSRKDMTRSVLKGLHASLLVSASRNRALTYNKMYLLHQAGQIPHLGTIKMDSRHPDLADGWSRAELDLLDGYKTDFKPVTGRAMVLIKSRGKRSAEFIITQYLKHLIAK